MNRIIEKHQLVGIAADLFRMKGYAGTSIDDIARACGLTKGSLYHHFAGKEALALAALDQVHQHYRDQIFSIILAHDSPGVPELNRFNTEVEAFFARHPHGCLLANLSMEGGQAADPFGRRIGAFFDEWLSCYVKVFSGEAGARAGADADATQALARAEDALAAVHGCILMHRIRHNLQPLRRQHAALVQSCSVLPTPTASPHRAPA